MLLDKKKSSVQISSCTTEPRIASFLFMGQNARHATSVYVNTFHPWRSPPGTFRGSIVVYRLTNYVIFVNRSPNVVVSFVGRII